MTNGQLQSVDDLDRIFKHLLRTIRERYPQYLERPFDVAELHQTILPYRHHRRELGINTNEDYEIALTQLLAGARGYLVVDERMRDALAKELESPNPDPGAFREFPDAQVGIAPDALGETEGVGPRAEGRGATDEGLGPTDEGRGPRAEGLPRAESREPRADKCRYCDASLPSGRSVTFCPHCGENLTVLHCAGCAGELEPGWRYCPGCGRPGGTG